MAHIYNIKNKVITECLNRDVIKVCTKDPLHYIVKDKLDELKEAVKLLEPDKADTQDNESRKVSLSKMKLDDLKSLAEELGLDGSGLNCDELRKIIKDAQGR